MFMHMSSILLNFYAFISCKKPRPLEQSGARNAVTLHNGAGLAAMGSDEALGIDVDDAAGGEAQRGNDRQRHKAQGHEGVDARVHAQI